jgi:hypothetical protein
MILQRDRRLRLPECESDAIYFAAGWTERVLGALINAFEGREAEIQRRREETEQEVRALNDQLKEVHSRLQSHLAGSSTIYWANQPRPGIPIVSMLVYE